ncbi:TRAF-like family protein [Prunus dulcis]|uniref:TRAF-like family protein n=1 Tax=Prunus dulcis TaxID=3755 RepID=A0A4Y1RKZ5_PRUDU|nr:TRAF-like family protein [Prunus dulcis]
MVSDIEFQFIGCFDILRKLNFGVFSDVSCLLPLPSSQLKVGYAEEDEEDVGNWKKKSISGDWKMLLSGGTLLQIIHI